MAQLLFHSMCLGLSGLKLTWNTCMDTWLWLIHLQHVAWDMCAFSSHCPHRLVMFEIIIHSFIIYAHRSVRYCSLKGKLSVLTFSLRYILRHTPTYALQSLESQYQHPLAQLPPLHTTERTANPLSASNWRAGADCWINSKLVQRSPAPSAVF